MWYRVTYELKTSPGVEYTELIFSWEDMIRVDLAAHLEIDPTCIAILELLKYDIKEGMC